MTQSQYTTAVDVGGGVLVAGMGVLVAGTGLGRDKVGVAEGAVCVIATIVWEMTAWSVASAPAWDGWFGPSRGMAKMVTGRQAIMARAIMPNKIRILLVVTFILHLQ
jgi:hypothetical protein